MASSLARRGHVQLLHHIATKSASGQERLCKLDVGIRARLLSKHMGSKSLEPLTSLAWLLRARAAQALNAWWSSWWRRVPMARSGGRGRRTECQQDRWRTYQHTRGRLGGILADGVSHTCSRLVTPSHAMLLPRARHATLCRLCSLGCQWAASPIRACTPASGLVVPQPCAATCVTGRPPGAAAARARLPGRRG